MEPNADVYQDKGSLAALHYLLSQEEPKPFTAVRDCITPSPTQCKPEGSAACSRPTDGLMERQAATCEAF